MLLYFTETYINIMGVQINVVFTTVPEPNTVLGRVFSEHLEPSRSKGAGSLVEEPRQQPAVVVST